MLATAGCGFHESPVLARICIAAARALYIGPGLDLAPHLNVATTLAVGLREPFALRTWSTRERWSPWEPGDARVIPSGTLHHLSSRGPMAFLYFDPLTDQRAGPDDMQLRTGTAHLRASFQRIGIIEAFAAFGLVSAPPKDARIARVARTVERDPDALARVGDAAALACLSPSRFRARFDAQVGIPFRRYRLWRRMAVMMRALHDGNTLTQAAMIAGFASSAHLSSTFRRMFGIAPSDVLGLGATIDVSEDRLSIAA